MRTARPIHKPSTIAAVRELPIQGLLEWAFGREKANLDAPEEEGGGIAQCGVSIIHVLIERANVGCRIDGGQHKRAAHVHDDAEVIAAIVGGLSDDLGGFRMAVYIAGLARAGLTPDWMPGATPRCVPAETHTNRHGTRAKTYSVGIERFHDGRKARAVEVFACRVRYHPYPSVIASARRGYSEWRAALAAIRDALEASRMMTAHKVTSTLPPAEPWIKRRHGS